MSLFRKSSLTALDLAEENLKKNPGQEAYTKLLNVFATEIYNKTVVYPMIMMEHMSEIKGPVMRLNRMKCDDKSYFSFYTSEAKYKKSPFDADFANLSLDMVVELTLSDESISGLIINPSNGTDITLPASAIRVCYEAAKNGK